MANSVTTPFGVGTLLREESSATGNVLVVRLENGATAHLNMAGIDGVTTQNGDGAENMSINPDGSKTVRHGDGSVTQTNSDGSKISIGADGTRTQTEPDGTQIHVDKDGTKTQSNADGSTIVQFADGRAEHKFTDGTVIEVKSDGSKLQRNPDGTSIVTSADGKRHDVAATSSAHSAPAPVPATTSSASTVTSAPARQRVRATGPAVRLDADSGLVFFENPVDAGFGLGDDGHGLPGTQYDSSTSTTKNGAMTSWQSPLATPDGLPPMLIDPNDREQERVIHKLCGHDTTPAPPGPEAKAASRRMRRWMERTGVKVGATSAIALRWPQFFGMSSARVDEHSLRVTVQLTKPDEGAGAGTDTESSGHMTKLIFKCEPSTTVGEVLRLAFRKFERSIGQPLDAAGHNSYVFKVLGQHSFLLDHTAPLSRFHYVRECLRESSEVMLTLHKLSGDEEHEVRALLADDDAAHDAPGASRSDSFEWDVDLESPSSHAARSSVNDSALSMSSMLATSNLSAAQDNIVDMQDVLSGKVTKSSITAPTQRVAFRARGSLVAATQQVPTQSGWLSKQTSTRHGGAMQYAGWLTKKAGSKNIWAKRWFVLSHGVLKYYLDETLATEKGRIDLTRRMVQRPTDKRNKYPFGFEITAQEKPKAGVKSQSSSKESSRIYQVYAKSDQEMKLWMSHIGFCCGMGHGEVEGAGERTEIGSDGGMEWPFRVRIHGVEAAPSNDMPRLSSYFVRVNLNHCGNVLPPNNAAVAAAAAVAAGDGAQDADGVDPSADWGMETDGALVSTDPTWRQWLVSPNYSVPFLPPTTRLSISLMAITFTGDEVCVGGVSLPLFGMDGMLLTGTHAARLWPSEELQVARDPSLLNPKSESIPLVLDTKGGVCGENYINDCGVLHFELESFTCPVHVQHSTLSSAPRSIAVSPDSQHGVHDDLTKSGLMSVAAATASADAEAAAAAARAARGGDGGHGTAELQRIEALDRLSPLTGDDKALLWSMREECLTRPRLMPKLLQAVDWGDASAAAAARALLLRWAPFGTSGPHKSHLVDAMELLDVRFADTAVREFAVVTLEQMHDDELEQYLLQLVQLLKYELYHISALSRFLVRRALRNPLGVGNTLYWLLKSEMHNPHSHQRFGVVLDAYVRRCGSHRQMLFDSLTVESLLLEVAHDIKHVKKTDRLRITRERLSELNAVLPETFQLGNWPHFRFSGIVADKCKVMDSKKKPLMLVLSNADPLAQPIRIIYKEGDDLRQDLMTLQMIRLIDRLWLSEGLDLRMLPYGCCATGNDTGLIEMVPNSDTIAHIQQDYGGKMTGAFRKSPINDFLKANAPSDKAYDEAVENFIRSCAGYCVATFCLGIGDRHADNIMTTRDGNLFHIDFGHFLGHFKSKKIMPGVKILRERSPFVFDPAMAYVMGGTKDANFARFQDMCCQAYNILRENGNLFINLFVDMIPASMPELLGPTDVEYLKNQLSLQDTNAQADASFREEIRGALATTSRQFDNMVHNLVH